jgi:nanoRNase/pAp phosphatase (c-di-AMP/oligoRNAs hydrolase)
VTTSALDPKALIRSREFVSSFSNHLTELRGKRVGVLTHLGGDQDSIAAAYVLGNLLRGLYGSDVVKGVHMSGEVSDVSERFAAALSIQLAPELPEAGHYVAVDACSPSQLGSALPSILGRLTVVDHYHVGDQWPEGIAVFAFPDYKSCSEIVLDLCILNGRSLNAVEPSALFFGIYYDTVRLTVADALILKKVGLLGAYGSEPSSCAEALEAPPDYSERVARLKGLKEVLPVQGRERDHRRHKGRCLPVVGSQDVDQRRCWDSSGRRGIEGFTDVVFRVSPEVVKAYSINVVRNVIGPLTSKLGGEGGGHAAAARVRVPGAFDEVVARCLELLGSALGTYVEALGPIQHRERVYLLVVSTTILTSSNSSSGSLLMEIPRAWGLMSLLHLAGAPPTVKADEAPTLWD